MHRKWFLKEIEGGKSGDTPNKRVSAGEDKEVERQPMVKTGLRKSDFKLGFQKKAPGAQARLHSRKKLTA